MFKSLAEMIALADESGQPLHQIVLAREAELTQRPPEAIWAMMAERLQVMRRSTEEGLARPIRSLSGISGGSAWQLWQHLQTGYQPVTGPILSRAVARAMAVNEVNAGMGCIVATPTAGSAGILPGVLLTLQEAYGFSDEQLVAGLFTASGVGAVIAHRASISGAAGGAAQCFIAIDLAMAGVESIIPPDEVIDAMADVGRNMHPRFKETAAGGLAATPTGRRLAALIWQGKPGEGEPGAANRDE